MKIDLSKLTDEQLVNTLIELDKVRLSTSKKIDTYKAELQSRGISLMENRSKQYCQFFGDVGSVFISDKQKLDLVNPDRLREWLSNGVYKKNVTETTEPHYKLTPKLETMLKAIATDDYTFEMTLEQLLDQLHRQPDSDQRKVLLKKLTGEFDKDRKLFNSVFDTDENWEEEIYYVHKIKRGELIAKFLPDANRDKLIDELKKCIVVEASLAIGLNYETE